MKYQDLLSKVAEELKLPEEVIKNIYSSYWSQIKVILTKLPLKENLTKEEFDKLNNSINVPHLGKIGCSYKRYVGIKNKFNKK